MGSSATVVGGFVAPSRASVPGDRLLPCCSASVGTSGTAEESHFQGTHAYLQAVEKTSVER